MKWTPQYEGPYLVLKMLSPVVAKIQQSSRTKPKIVHIDKLKKFEGEEPRMWSAAEVALAARRDRDREGVTGPYIPSFSANERSNLAGGEARAMGEARVFEDAVSADEPINSSSTLEVMESVDGLTAPPSFVQSGRNQMTKLPESTDGLMYPACGLMETSERVESESESGSPLVVTELNAVDGHLSSVSDGSEATIPVVPAMHAVARAGVCPNFSHGDPFIIIEESEENSGEKYPMMSSTVAEPVCWERSDQDATVTTSATDFEQEIRTGLWDDSYENSSLSVETSRGRINDCCATSNCTISGGDGMSPLGPAVTVEDGGAINSCDTVDVGVGCSDEGSSERLAAELSAWWCDWGMF